MLNRRDMVRTGLAFVALTGVARAAEEAAPKPAAGADSSDTQQAFAKALGHCVIAGTECLQHCLTALGTGDTSLAECSKTVRDMLAVCGAEQILVLGESRRAKTTVRLCIDVCTDCEAACRKHEAHHAVCKACADACAATITAARAFVA